MLHEQEIFAKNGSPNRPQEGKSMSEMVGILLIYACLTAVILKDAGMTGQTMGQFQWAVVQELSDHDGDAIRRRDIVCLDDRA